MANLKAKDADSIAKFIKSSGAGTETDPLIVEHLDSATVAKLEFISNQLSTISDYTNSLELLLTALANYTDDLESTLIAINNKISPSFVLKTPVYSIGSEAYYSSSAGGNTCFNASSGVITTSTSGATTFIFANPGGSGIDVGVARIIISSDTAGRYERYRNGTFTMSGASQTPVNRGGGANTPKAMAYIGANATATGGILGKVQYIHADDEDVSRIDGSIILRPGQNLFWKFFPKGSTNTTANSTIEVVWYEAVGL